MADTTPDYSNSPLTPTQVIWTADGTGFRTTLSNTVGGLDPKDYVTFTVPAGQRLTSFELSSYSSSDGVAFIALQPGSSVTGSESNTAPFSGYSHFGSSASLNVGTNLISVLGGPLEAGTYSGWIQQLGTPTDYKFQLNATLTDTTPPSVSITSSSLTLNKGDIATITFSFSEPVTTFSLSDVIVRGGKLEGLKQLTDSVYTAFFTPDNLYEYGSFWIGNGYFKDYNGNKNADGWDEDNWIYIKVNSFEVYKAFSSDSPTTYFDVSSGYLADRFPQGASIISTPLDFVDLDNDGAIEVVAYLSPATWASPLGITPDKYNDILILQIQNNRLVDVTTKFTDIKLTNLLKGMTRNSFVADLNGDGRKDIGLAINNEYGGSPTTWADNGYFLLSNDRGKYDLVRIGDNYGPYESVGGAPATGELPGLVFAGTQEGFTTVYVFDGINAKYFNSSEFVVGGGGILHVPQWDDPLKKERYFIIDSNQPNVVGGEGFRILKWSFMEGVTISDNHLPYYFEKHVDRSFGSQIVHYYNDFKDSGMDVIFAGSGNKFWWTQYPGSEPLLVVASYAYLLQDNSISAFEKNLSNYASEMPTFYDFFKVSKDGIESVAITIKDFDPQIHANYNYQSIDVNRDGYDDIVVGNHFGVVQPEVYLNDTNGGLYRIGKSVNINPERRATVSSRFSKLFDMNSDGKLDVVFWSDASLTNGNLIWGYLGNEQIFTGPGFNNPALDGVPGFNEYFYLTKYPEVAALVAAGNYANGLAHYLAVGRGKGLEAFAPHVWVHGFEGLDNIVLREGNEMAFGYGGNDSIRGGTGSDRLDGGDGIDTAIFEKARSAYKTEKLIQDNTTIWKVTDLATGDVDELRNIEKLEFAKASVAGFQNLVQTEVTLDVAGTPAVAYRLYKAAFARDPDLGGLGYWISALEQYLNPNLSPEKNPFLLDVAKTFVESPEFKAKYGADVDNATYIRNLYKNALGRDPLIADPVTGKTDAGYTYWVGVLDAKAASRSDLFVYFSESAENKAAVAPIIATGVEYVPWVPPGG